MAHDRSTFRIARRHAIVLAGLLAGMVSAALLTDMVAPPSRPHAVRGAI